jgi:hypothetical protein
MCDPTRRDTAAEAEAILTEGYRRMTPRERLERASQLTLAVQRLACADILRRHSEAGDREIRLRLASRWLDPDVMRRAFGWDPDREGY